MVRRCVRTDDQVAPLLHGPVSLAIVGFPAPEKEAMSKQGELYGGLPPFERGSDTSRTAAVALEGSGQRNAKRARVYKFIIDRGEYGATDSEIERALGMGGNTERPRRRELVLMGLVVDSGKRRLTATRRQAAVWVVKDQGKR